MRPIRTVLCPVDFSPATARQVELAADLCRAYGARLALHHNLSSAGTSAAVGWMWTASHPPESEQAVEAKLNALLEGLSGVTAEAHITRGPSSQAVVAIGEALDADLVVLTAHQTHSDEHASVVEQVLADGRRAALVLHEAEADATTPRFASASRKRQPIVVPTDFSADAEAAVGLALDLARRLPVHLHLVHLLPHDAPTGTHDEARTRLASLLPEELAAHGTLHVEHGDPAEGIARLAGDVSAACIVMGEHTRRPIRRWFTRRTDLGVLEGAPCPVWYVPGRPASQPSA